MNIYTVELKNQPGELAHVCEVLGRSGVNIEPAGATAGDHGTDLGGCRKARILMSRPWRRASTSMPSPPWTAGG